MLSPHDRLAFCTALQRLSKFTAAELALISDRKLRQAQEFLHGAPGLVRIEMARGHDPKRPMREYWAIVGDRLPLYREIERLRAENHSPPLVGDLFNGIDRLLRDVAASEQALDCCSAPEDEQFAEQAHLAAQRRGIDHALVDLEVSVARAIRARRKSNHVHRNGDVRPPVHASSPGWSQLWFERSGAALLDWSTASEHVVTDGHATLSTAGGGLSDDPLADEVARLAACPEIDEESIRRTVSALRNVRASWREGGDFGEALDAEFRHVFRQAFGHRLLGPLAVVAAALAETACAQSLFEGWVLSGKRAAPFEDPFPLVPAVLARLSFETHLQAGKKWTANPAASICQYVLTTPLAPLGALLAAAGSLLSEAPDLNHVFACIARNHGRMPKQIAIGRAASISRTLWLALFLQTDRPSPLEAIPSLPELPGGEELFDVLLEREHGAVVHRLERSHKSGRHKGERYELRPGSLIEPLLSRRFGEKEVCLAMQVTRAFERRRTEATSSARWTLTAAPRTSFLGELEAAGSAP